MVLSVMYDFTPALLQIAATFPISATEKFSQFAEFYKQCLTADTKIYSEKPQLRTGVFARAAGRRVSGDIAEIEVEGGAK